MVPSKKPRRRRIGLAVGAVVAIVIGIAVALWNKPHPKAEDQKGVALTAEVLYAAFQKGRPVAKTYEGNVVAVTGTVAETGANGDGKTTAALQTGDPDGGVIQCTFREPAAVKPGQPVVVKGFCNGYTDLAPLGGTVVLNDCLLIQP